MKYPTEDELREIKEYAILPLVLKVFERDRKLITALPWKITEPYIRAIDIGWNRAHFDWAQTKKSLRVKGVYFYDQLKTEKGIAYYYTYHGFNHSSGFLWDYLKSQVELRMRYYLGDDVQF